VVLEFVDNEGVLRKLNKPLIAPVNKNWHTYQLLWGPHNRYEVKIDNHSAIKGFISEDFSSQAHMDIVVKYSQEGKPHDW